MRYPLPKTRSWASSQHSLCGAVIDTWGLRWRRRQRRMKTCPRRGQGRHNKGEPPLPAVEENASTYHSCREFAHEKGGRMPNHHRKLSLAAAKGMPALPQAAEGEPKNNSGEIIRTHPVYHHVNYSSTGVIRIIYSKEAIDWTIRGLYF